ncbi:MAG: hypothetical protein U1F71_08395 [Verrucomicrobiaceae bacterium]
MHNVLTIISIVSGIMALALLFWLWDKAATHRDRDIPDHEKIGWMPWDMIAWLLTDGLFQFVVELGKLPATVRAAIELWHSDPSYRSTCRWSLVAIVAAMITTWFSVS